MVSSSRVAARSATCRERTRRGTSRGFITAGSFRTEACARRSIGASCSRGARLLTIWALSITYQPYAVPGSVTVAQKTLDLFVGVRILPGKGQVAGEFPRAGEGPLRLSVRT